MEWLFDMKTVSNLSMISITVIFPLGLCYYLVQKANANLKSASAQTAQFEDRIQALESRVGDVQDVVLSIDDQLKQMTRQDIPLMKRELS